MRYEYADVHDDLSVLKRGDEIIIRSSDYEKFHLHYKIEMKLRAQARAVRGRYIQRPLNNDNKMPILAIIINQNSEESNQARRNRSRRL